MKLTPGSSVGPYKILSSVGAGGMGEVYRAEHVRLGREVAIKVLPQIGGDDPVRRERFEREARVLASLNHPNIAILHAVEDCGGDTLLEMELVPGETMAERIARGPIPIVEALGLFKQVAEALEAAHERGIIHRDLKPANVKITPAGQVKVLDFGLAKPFEKGAIGSAPDSPMFTTTTQGGMVFGTAAYMSPEQVRGKALDRRTDIWAFGCMLFEALSGRTPFEGDTMSDTLAAVLRSEPDWSALPKLPIPLERLVRRCLQKDRQMRLRDIADARLEIAEALGDTAALRAPSSDAVSRPRVAYPYRLVLLVIASLALVGAAALWISRITDRPVAPIARVVIPLLPGQQLDRSSPAPMAIAPDGSRVVYVGSLHSGRPQLYVRPLDRFEATPVNATEGATAPFFSPDGRWVGFYAAGALQKVSLDGGVALRICETPPVWSANWAADDSIVFATAGSPNGLWRVTAAGGAPDRLTTADVQHGEVEHAYPQVLPNGDVLFEILTPRGWRLALLSIADRKSRALGEPGTGAPAVYVQPGYLVYAQSSGGLVAVPFDVGRDALGAPRPLIEPVPTDPSGAASFAISDSGALLYVPRPETPPARAVMTAARDGRVTELVEAHASYAHPRFSRDGTRLAVAIDSPRGSDIWVFDLRRGTRTRLTTDGVNRYPVWTPDGRSITFQSTNAGRATLYSVPADGSAAPTPLMPAGSSPAAALSRSLAGVLPGTAPVFPAENPQVPMSWSPDGAHLAFEDRKPSGDRDIWVLERGGEPAPFLLTQADEHAAAFSPDGAWLAYVSDESGRSEVYVQPYPGPGGKWTISTEGGSEPVWSPSARELFYRDGDHLMAVSVQTKPQLEIGQPRPVLQARFDTLDGARNYDPAPDGGSFAVVRSDAAPAQDQFRVVLNWARQLASR